MHLANGTLANSVCAATAVAATASVLCAGYRARGSATPSNLARVAVGSGLVLALQMIDVPLFGAVSVHMVGAAFLSLLAGPALALLGMTAVIVFQALVLNDGGIATLGANVLNMAVVGVSVAALATHVVRARVKGSTGVLSAVIFASAASVLAATIAMTAELTLSGTPLDSALGLTIPAHAPFAAWESLCTIVLVVAAGYVRAIEPFAAASSSK
jgi:cobalt/nickel transport system permease protein